MIFLRRIGALCVGAAAIAGGTVAPASADVVPPADGHYTYHEDGLSDLAWTLQSVCSQASGTRAQSDYSDTTIQTQGCVVNVTSNPGTPTTKQTETLAFSQRGRLAGGQWAVSYSPINGGPCPDGTIAPITQNFTFDQATLTGTHTTLWGAECGQPGMTKVPFTLSFNGPLDPPAVDRFPMQCDYLAGRPSICS